MQNNILIFSQYSYAKPSDAIQLFLRIIIINVSCNAPSVLKGKSLVKTKFLLVGATTRRFWPFFVKLKNQLSLFHPQRNHKVTVKLSNKQVLFILLHQLVVSNFLTTVCQQHNMAYQCKELKAWVENNNFLLTL